ncbi:hypothetical protein ACLGIH_12645 [Streptomyces sp. HMX87]|uniref:hypothetical protein n=1 Tax=Streptomyces sp. HMX87 TaxID=3390849 RepID=UPI003A899387
MRLSATDDIETGLVDLSDWGFQEVLALSDPRVVQAQDSLLRELVNKAVGQAGPGGGGGSPHFATQRRVQEELGAAGAPASPPGRPPRAASC